MTEGTELEPTTHELESCVLSLYYGALGGT